MKRLAFAFIFISLSSHAAKIKESECAEMKGKLGQLFYINVDGFGSNHTIHPAYEKLIKKMQPGGVLPHYNSKDIGAIKTASQRLQVQSNLPLMIGIDYQSMNGTNIGLGWGTGLADKLGKQDVSCFEKVGKIEAALHQYAGINNPLGPTVEYNLKSEHGFASQDLDYKKARLSVMLEAFRNAGLETTLKHFPYTPSDYNLHKTSKDTKIPVDEVDSKYMPIYRELAGQSGMLMTTHLFNSEVDPSNMATFSKVWMKKLRNEVGFKGLVVTDALFMINSYPDTMKQMSRDWPKHLANDFSKDLTRFAVKSILAGHDMVFLETSANETEAIYDDVAKFACTDDPMAKDFRKRVRESHKRITDYKKANPQLKTNSSLTPEDAAKLIAARKKGSQLCKEDFSELEKIVAKAKSKKTIIDDSVFCDPFDFNEGHLSSELAKLALDNSELAKNLIVNSIDNQEDYNTSLKFLAKNPEMREKISQALKQDFFTGDKAKKSKALEQMAKLGMLEKDSAVIDEIVRSGSVDDFKAYLELGNANSVAPLSDKVSLEQRLLLHDKVIAENKLDLTDTKTNKMFVTLNEVAFPEAFYNSLNDETLTRISPVGDAGILFKFRKANRGMKLSPEESLRVMEAYIKNPKLNEYAFSSTFCNEYEGIECIEERQSTEDVTFLASDVKPDDLMTIPQAKKDELIKLLDSEIPKVSPTIVERYRSWELKKLNLVLKNDKAEYLKVGNALATESIEALTKKEYRAFSMAGWHLEEIQERYTSEEFKALNNKIITHIKTTWNPEYVQVSELRNYMNRYPDDFEKEIKLFPPEEEDIENDLSEADE